MVKPYRIFLSLVTFWITQTLLTWWLPAGRLRGSGSWAMLLGGIGFAGGFFGPIVFAPEANQGPLLGIFITGPIGFALGGLLGPFLPAPGRGTGPAAKGGRSGDWP